MEIKLNNQEFNVLDTKEKITIADSFVVRQNKIGGGNGEAKLYIGQDNQETRSFFGNNGFAIPCFLMMIFRGLIEFNVESISTVIFSFSTVGKRFSKVEV